MITSLPLELLLLVAKQIPLREYNSLRRTCRLISLGLDAIPQLTFSAYIESTSQYPTEMQLNHLARIPWDELSDQSFMFILKNAHKHEFARILHSSRSCMFISMLSKQVAFKTIINNDLPPEMIIPLMADPSFNPNMTISFSCAIGTIEEGTVMHWACARGFFDLIRLFIEDPRCDFLSRDEVGCTPLHLAAAVDQPQIMEILLSKFSPNVQNDNGWMPLHYAAVNGLDKVVAVILNDPRSEPQAQDHDGWQPLHFSARFNKLSTTKLLISDSRVTPHPLNNYGKRPLDIARECRNRHIVKLLSNSLKNTSSDSNRRITRSALKRRFAPY